MRWRRRASHLISKNGSLEDAQTNLLNAYGKRMVNPIPTDFLLTLLIAKVAGHDIYASVNTLHYYSYLIRIINF